MKKSIIVLVVMSLTVPFNIMAQEGQKAFEPTFNWKGFTHIWTGYGQRDTLDGHYGFAVRYLRFKAYGKLTENVKWAAQFAYDKGSPSLLDVHISYEPVEYLKVRFGQFPVPGAKSGVMSSPIWSTTKMKFNDRTTITQNWAANAGLKGYRSGGAMLYGSFLDKKINYYAMAAMPQSGPDNYFNPSVKSTVYGHDENGVAGFGRLEIKPSDKIETGVNYHYGKGTTADTAATYRSSYSVYFLTRQEKLFAMAEFIGGTNKQHIHDTLNSEFTYMGWYVELGYNLAGKFEPAVRFDCYTPIKDGADADGYKRYRNLTLGFNYYPAKNIALMANYVVRLEEPDTGAKEIKNDLIYLQLRYLFASKK